MTRLYLAGSVQYELIPQMPVTRSAYWWLPAAV